MTSGPITSWEIDGETWLTLFFWDPKSLWMLVAAMKLKDTCSLEGSYDQPRQDILKQRHYFANKVHLVKAMVFPEVMHGCVIWTIKKAKHQRIDAFELCYGELSREFLGVQEDQTSQS